MAGRDSALEAFALAEFRGGRIDEVELMRMLGFEIRWQLDGFLKSHGIFVEHTLEEFEEEQRTLRRLGY